ncbi:MAG TPA: hypothetical protein VIW19_09615 [Gaiellaceae bacterium]
MTESELSARFAPLADAVDDQSWAEVVARARTEKRHRRRVPIAIAAVVACAVVIVSPATGLRGQIVRLFDRGGPPPQEVVQSFAQWNGPQFRAHVEAGRAIKVLDARVTPDTTLTLWVAPTKSGGFCTSAGSCYQGGFRYDRLSVEVCLCGRVAPDGEILAGPVVLSGETTNGKADSLLLRYQDGERQSVPLVWVGKPVDTAFFVYGVPERHWQAGHLPTTLTMLSANGDELDTREINGITPKGSAAP